MKVAFQNRRENGAGTAKDSREKIKVDPPLTAYIRIIST